MNGAAPNNDGWSFTSAEFVGTPNADNYCYLDNSLESVSALLAVDTGGRLTLTAGSEVTVTLSAGMLTTRDTPAVTDYSAYEYLGSASYSGFTITVVDAPPPVGMQYPAPVLQQVGIPSSGSCADVQDADLAWGTGLSGGWTRAWGEWANNRAGGWVCSRWLEYRPHTSRWAVGT